MPLCKKPPNHHRIDLNPFFFFFKICKCVVLGKGIVMCDVFCNIKASWKFLSRKTFFSLNYNMSRANLQFQRPTTSCSISQLTLGVFVCLFVFCSHMDVGKLHGGRIKLEEWYHYKTSLCFYHLLHLFISLHPKRVKPHFAETIPAFRTWQDQMEDIFIWYDDGLD